MTKKQIIQLSILTFFLYLIIFYLMVGGYEYYDAFVVLSLTILLGLFIIYSKKDCKFSNYLKILLYIILAYLIYSIIDNVVSFYSLSLRIFYNETPFGVFCYLLKNGFNLLYALITSAVLLLNKPARVKTFRIWKLRITL